MLQAFHILQGLYPSGIICFRHSISYRDFKLYASCIPYPSGILNYMLHAFHILQGF
jgi:hypothetical protein